MSNIKINIKNFIFLPLIFMFLSAFAFYVPFLHGTYLCFYLVLYITLIVCMLAKPKLLICRFYDICKNTPLKIYMSLLILITLFSFILSFLGITTLSQTIRSVIIMFCLSTIPIFEEKNGTKPVLLLDDIFSELDIKKRNKLLKIINLDDVQSIITTTDLRNINKKYVENAYIFNVNNGNVERK